MTDKEKIKLAAKYGNLNTVKTVLSDIYDRRKYDEALIQGARYGNLEVVSYVYENKSPLPEHIDSAFRRAASNGHLQIIIYLLDVVKSKHVDIQAAGARAVIGNQLPVLKYLVSMGLDPQCYSNIFLESAAKCGNIDIIKYLMDNCKIPNVTNICLVSIESGQLNLVKYFVNNGFDVKTNGNNALKKAMQFGHLDIAKYFVEMGCNMAHDLDILGTAAVGNHLDIIKYFANLGYNTSFCLNIGAKYGNFEIVKYALEIGCDPDDNEALNNSLFYCDTT
jgi:ankyrin repeat protein